MIEALFNQVNYAASKKMVDVSALRHEAIASNLANLETPGYKRVDVAPTFQTELKQALASGEAGQVSALQPQLQIDSAAQTGRIDGNTVQLENELGNLQKNALEHALGTQLVSSNLLRLRLAITGRS